MADGKFTTTAAVRVRKANEYFASLKGIKPPGKLFDEFWRKGELALFFGPARTGKSILAMQMAESIARGHAIDGFGLGTWRQKVLYVDLRLSDRQFVERYSNEGRQYKLSENLYREKPEAGEKLIDWLRTRIRKKGFRVIMVDDLSAIRMSYDGTRETLKLMRELRQLKDELDLSILVMSNSQAQRNGELISEAHMMRSRVLCDVADSVFAMGVHASNPNWRYITQTRSLTEMKWHGSNIPVCSIQRSDEGFLCMGFDKRFVANIDEETRQLICQIKWRRDAKASYISIAEELGIPKSKVFRLSKKWTPALEKDPVVEPRAGAEDLDADQAVEADHTDRSNDIDPANPPHPPKSALNRLGENRGFYPKDISNIPFLAALKRIHITELKRGIDGLGREMFIAKEQHHDGKPITWYQYDSNGNVIRKDRNSWGVSISHLDSPWVPFKAQVARE